MKRRRRLFLDGLRPRRRDLEREVDEELRFHLEKRTEQLIASGLSPREARQEAERRFGARAEVRDECVTRIRQQEQRRMRFQRLSEFASDIRYALRSLRRRPGFTLAAVAGLAVGIGGSTAVFSIFDAVLLRSLPYRNPEELVLVWPERRSLAEFEAFQEMESFARVSGHGPGDDLTLTGSGEPARLRGFVVSTGLFDNLGVPLLAGRGFLAEDAVPGSPKVAILSERLCRQRFGPPARVVGRALELDGELHTVVGVMPAEFRFPNQTADLWLPLVLDRSNQGAYWGSYYVTAVGRLSAGATPESAAAELQALAGRLRLENPVWTPAEEYLDSVAVEPLQSHMAGELRPLLVLLLGAVGLVLVVVCVNLANLQLARSAARVRESAVRASLGATRGRIVSLLLTETLVLNLLGAGLGLLLASLLVEVLVPLLPGVDGRFGQLGVDHRVLLFSLAVALVTTLGVGLLPALRLSRTDLRTSLAEGGRGMAAGTGQFSRAALVVAQVALAVVLVVNAGLLLRSFWNLWQVPTGFDGARVLSARLDPAEGLYEDRARRRQLYDDLLERLRALPGVARAAAAHSLPLSGVDAYLAHRVKDQEWESGRLPMARQRIVTPGYFETMGIPLLAGRDFDGTDRHDGPQAVIVNRALAEKIWPGETALGKSIGYPWNSPWVEVVGVVENVLEGELDGEVEPALYFPYSQRSMASMTVLVAGAGLDPHSLAPGLREAVRQLDDQIPVNDVQTVAAVAWRSIARPRFAAALLAAFAAIALGLGALGIYAVIAYLVQQRSHEFGVRLALGASPEKIQRQVVSQGLRLGLVGLALGLVGALAASRGLEHLLFQVSPLDAGILAGAGVLLLAVALAACYLPARRAARVDPLQALRAE